VYRCLQRVAAHPGLLSFPTRRSSDLGGSERMSRRTYYMWRATQLRAAAARQRESSLAMREAEAIIREGMLAEGETSNTFGAATADRKSTRLNSSHVKISYAVFCLKKK